MTNELRLKSRVSFERSLKEFAPTPLFKLDTSGTMTFFTVPMSMATMTTTGVNGSITVAAGTDVRIKTIAGGQQIIYFTSSHTINPRNTVAITNLGA